MTIQLRNLSSSLQALLQSQVVMSSYGMGALSATGGSVFYVQSVHANASDSNAGTASNLPLATIDAAIGKCTANNGDIILVSPGHIETVTAAGGVAVDVAGITIIGVGSGANRPKVNFTSAVGASFLITAANCTVNNILFTGGIDALTNPIHIQAADCSLLGIETRDVTGQATVFILTTAAADRLRITGWKHLGAAAAGADTALTIVGGDAIVVEEFTVLGNFAIAAIRNVTTLTTQIRIGGGRFPNYIWTQNSADVAVALAATSTGFVGPNIYAMLTDNAANITEAFVGAAAFFMQPISIVNLAGESSMFTNITASTDA